MSDFDFDKDKVDSIKAIKQHKLKERKQLLNVFTEKPNDRTLLALVNTFESRSLSSNVRNTGRNYIRVAKGFATVALPKEALLNFEQQLKRIITGDC